MRPHKSVLLAKTIDNLDFSAIPTLAGFSLGLFGLFILIEKTLVFFDLADTLLNCLDVLALVSLLYRLFDS